MSKIKTKIKEKKKLNKADSLEKQISRQFSCTKNREITAPLLYRIVYSSKISFITVFILLLSFVFQGVTLTYAQEETPSSVETNNDDMDVDSVQEDIEVSDTAEEQPEVDDVVLNDTEIHMPVSALEVDESVENIPTNVELNTHSLTSIENIPMLNSVGNTSDISPPLDDPPINNSITTEEDLESLPTNDILSVLDLTNASTSDSSFSSSTDIVSTGEELEQTDEVTEDAPLDEADLADDEFFEGGDNNTSSSTEMLTLTATTTLGTSTPNLLEEAVTVTNSDMEYTFNRNECTTLASGSFYCLKAEAELMEDALFSAPDIDGDLEIYLVRDGIQSQITSNLADDAAPFFDQNSDTIVWHRLVEDRYQIISYEISSGSETQLTFGHTNSMEPTRQGKYTVWQNWSNNNWNVVLFDGKEQKTITESSAHDIAPYVHGSLVVWNRYTTGQDKTIEMYDMISETYVTVDDPDGLSVTNPRMVFVYDSLHPNGDVVTKGYDMISRKFIQLDTLPRQLPDEIPQSESTGETRALIQSKPTVKSDDSIQNNNASSSGPVPPNPASVTSSDPMTLDLSIATSTLVDLPPVSEISALVEYELVIPPLESTTVTVQE